MCRMGSPIPKSNGMTAQKTVVPLDTIRAQILILRGHKVVLDSTTRIEARVPIA